MKKIITLLMALLMVACLTACSASASTTTTTTTTVTDADGNSTTTTETTTTATYPEGSCGEAAMDGEQHEVSISIENATGEDIYGFYMAQPSEESWGNAFDEGQVLADGETITDFGTLAYSLDSLEWDLGIEKADGTIVTYNAALPIATLDAAGFTITFEADGWNVRAEFCK